MDAASESRDWLLMSVTRSADHPTWYGTGRSGYTTCIIRAGRYTGQEARSEERSSHGQVIAVHLNDVMTAHGLFAVLPERRILEFKQAATHRIREMERIGQ